MFNIIHVQINRPKYIKFKLACALKNFIIYQCILYTEVRYNE